MGNLIKKSAGGLALQVTREARSAGLVEEDADGAATRLAPVHVFGVDDLLIVAETDRIEIDCRAHLVATAVSDTESVSPGGTATVEIAGNGYQLQLPGCDRAGLHPGDDGHCATAPGLLFIHDGTQTRLVSDLRAIRTEQLR